MVLGKQEDLQIYSDSLMTLVNSAMVDSLRIVLKRYILLNLFSKKENVRESKGSFLHLFVKIENHQLSIQLYDKRDDFTFSIVKMLYLRSSIPSKTFYSKYRSEILKTARTTTSKLVLSNNAKILTTGMCKEGERIKTLSHTLTKIRSCFLQFCGVINLVMAGWCWFLDIWLDSFPEYTVFGNMLYILDGILDFTVAEYWYHETCLIPHLSYQSWPLIWKFSCTVDFLKQINIM